MFVDNITQQEFDQFRRLLFEQTGISLSGRKQPLVVGRLGKRLRHYGLKSYEDYYHLITKEAPQGEELQVMVDLLTTNETHFFRESAHFDFLRNEVLKEVSSNQEFRVWSAASSSGEEAYSTAMVLHDVLGEGGWEVFGSDINNEILERAKKAQYPMEGIHEIPKPYLKKYCLKGVRSQEGCFLIDTHIKNHVRFGRINLNEELPDIGRFDFIFLRNVMIYFSQQTKQTVVARLLHLLKPGGYFVVGHSESLTGVTNQLRPIRPTIYQKPG